MARALQTGSWDIVLCDHALPQFDSFGALRVLSRARRRDIPLIVVSPFTKKNYVSHTVADFTAILTLIEKRYGISALTKRDAAQMDMTEFFDFSTPDGPWATPPKPPTQPKNLPCTAGVPAG